MTGSFVAESLPAPHRASWIDQLTDRVARLPGPALVPYLVAGVLVYGALTLGLWVSGAIAVGTLPIGPASLATALAGWPWLVGRFNEGARQAIRGVGPERLRDATRFELLERQLTTLPAVPTFLAGVAVAAIALLRVNLAPQLMTQVVGVTQPGATAVFMAILAGVAFVGSAYALKIVAQAWRIHQLLTNEVTISLFDVAPLYAFSRLTATMSVSLILSLLVFVLPVPGAVADPLGSLGVVVPLGLAALAFVLPLVGVHGRLVDEKERLLSINGEDLRAAAASLRQAVRQDDLPRMDPLQKALAGIEVEQRMLERNPTWPWQPETFRWVVGALMFPVALYLVQLVIQRLLVT